MRAELHVSASSLRLLESCPRAWAYRYLAGHAPEDTAAGLVLGRAIHAALALWFERLRDGQPEATEDEMLQIAHDMIAEAESGAVPILSTDEDEDLRAEVDRLIAAYRQKPLRPKRVLAVEQPFSLAVTSHPETGEVLTFEEHLSGVFDLVVEGHDGSLAVIDHKSGKRAPAIEGGFDLQMGLYRWAAEQLYRPAGPVRLYHHLLMRTKTPKVELREVPAAVANISEALEAVVSGIELINLAVIHDNPVRLLGRRRSWRCGSCSFRRRCASDRT